MDRWGERMVPPPTVPTSIEGIVHVINRSCPSLMLVISKKTRGI
jgi:hypothetical protein